MPFRRTLRLLNQYPDGRFWGAPRTTQWTSVPWMVLAITTGAACGVALIEFRAVMQRAMAAQHHNTRKKATIESARYLGLGFWDITYSFRVGPKLMEGKRVNACTLWPEKFGEMLWPWSSNYTAITTPGAQVEVFYQRGAGSVAQNVVINPGYLSSPSVPLHVMYIVLLGYVATFTWKKAIFLVKLNSLHTTQQGLTLLKRGEMHDLTNAPGENPVERFLNHPHPFHGITPVTEKRMLWGLNNFRDETRRLHDEAGAQFRTTRNQASLHELRREAQEEEMEEARRKESKKQLPEAPNAGPP